MNAFPSSADRAFTDLVAKAEADPSVLGLYLHGSQVFEGMATPHSDYDVGVITDESERARLVWRHQKTEELEWGPTSLAAFRSVALDWDTERYVYAHARVLIDRLDGQLTAVVREAGTFPAHNRERLPTMVDTYLNSLYRSLKSWRDGRPLEAHLDAAESIAHALWVIFAMHERVRPPNKYLRWELGRRPLDNERWDAAHLLARVQRILSDGNPDTQRSLYRDIESTARANGLGETVDSWGINLRVMHGDR